MQSPHAVEWTWLKRCLHSPLIFRSSAALDSQCAHCTHSRKGGLRRWGCRGLPWIGGWRWRAWLFWRLARWRLRWGCGWSAWDRLRWIRGVSSKSKWMLGRFLKKGRGWLTVKMAAIRISKTLLLIRKCMLSLNSFFFDGEVERSYCNSAKCCSSSYCKD